MSSSAHPSQIWSSDAAGDPLETNDVPQPARMHLRFLTQLETRSPGEEATGDDALPKDTGDAPQAEGEGGEATVDDVLPIDTGDAPHAEGEGGEAAVAGSYDAALPLPSAVLRVQSSALALLLYGAEVSDEFFQQHCDTMWGQLQRLTPEDQQNFLCIGCRWHRFVFAFPCLFVFLVLLCGFVGACFVGRL